MVDTGALYAEGRSRLTELLAGLGPEETATPVPTCPAWTVHDVVAHLAGVCADVLAGNIAGVATDEWTDAQVRARRDRPVRELLDEWSEVAPQVEALAENFPGRTGVQWIADLTTHEHDIRTALGKPGSRDSTGVDVGLEFLVTVGLGPALRARGLGPIEVRTGDRSWLLGSDVPESGADAEDLVAAALFSAGDPPVPDGPPVGAVEAKAFELFRALTGRRSARQIAGFGWTVDPEPFVPAFQFGPFTLSPVDVDE